MALLKLQSKKRKRIADRNRSIRKAIEQTKKWKATGKRGYARAAKKNSRQARRDKRAIAKLNRLIKRLESRPSPHFRYQEFWCNDGTPIPKSSKPYIDKLCKEVLEPMRAKFGSVHINSGYRHTSYNARIGGASSSYHIYDLRGGKAPACDFTCARGTPAKWAAYARSGKADGVGQYSTFVHVDQRGYTSHWRG